MGWVSIKHIILGLILKLILYTTEIEKLLLFLLEYFSEKGVPLKHTNCSSVTYLELVIIHIFCATHGECLFRQASSLCVLMLP